jgi:hypothetical protein
MWCIHVVDLQWNMQPFAHELYMQVHLMNFRIWFDVWGGMVGNINEAMARAAEGAKMIVVLLTEDYLKSMNCMLELRYAVACNKPLVFIRTANFPVEVPEWVQRLLDKYVCVDIASASDLGTDDGGVPKVFRFSNVMRKVLQWTNLQPERVRRDVSSEVFALRDLLSNGQHALATQQQAAGEPVTVQAQSVRPVCTRCGASFEPGKKGGCKSHSAYYMGGNIIAGRWVCCSQQEKGGMGCEDADHQAAPRAWTEMAGFGGCFQWDPK